MPAYAYPIKINRNRLEIRYDETFEIDDNALTLSKLSFVGKDIFSVQEQEWGGYIISVLRKRLETTDERDFRVAREEAYMKEYNKRHK